MGDVQPNRLLEKMKLERQKMQIELNVQDCKVRLCEIEGEKKRLEENVAASADALVKLDEQIAGIYVPGGEE